jgi:hypothetical protein
MLKKKFLPTPLILGIGVVLLTATVASVLAVDCNKKVRSLQMYESAACGKIQTSCADGAEPSCKDRQAIKLTNFNGTQRYFDTAEGSSTDHAVPAGTIVCGQVWDCERDEDDGVCTYGSAAISPTTGKPIERTRTYYDNDDCNVAW